MTVELTTILQPILLLGVGFLLGRYFIPAVLTIRAKFTKKD
jgi:hypothetical protein